MLMTLMKFFDPLKRQSLQTALFSGYRRVPSPAVSVKTVKFLNEAGREIGPDSLLIFPQGLEAGIMFPGPAFQESLFDGERKFRDRFPVSRDVFQMLLVMESPGAHVIDYAALQGGIERGIRGLFEFGSEERSLPDQIRFRDADTEFVLLLNQMELSFQIDQEESDSLVKLPVLFEISQQNRLGFLSPDREEDKIS